MLVQVDAALAHYAPFAFSQHHREHGRLRRWTLVGIAKGFKRLARRHAFHVAALLRLVVIDIFDPGRAHADDFAAPWEL